jgi:GAF domain-containing protein
VLEQATRVCDAKFGIVFRYEGGLFHPATWLNAPPAFVDFIIKQGAFAPQPGQPFGRLCESKAVISFVDRASDGNPSPVVRYGGARSSIAVPMLKVHDLVGAFFIYRTEVRPFTDRQIESVKNFAAQAVIAIENARLLNELRQRTDDLSESLEQQTATGEVLKVISNSASDLQTVFDTMAENAVRLCGAERAYVFRFDGKLLRAVAAYNAGPEHWEFVQRNPITPGRHSVSARAALERRSVQIADVQADPEFAYVLRDVEPIRTTLSVPMLKGDELVGTITIYRLEVKPFTDKQVALVETFAAQAVIAIENTRLLSELRESLQQQTATADVLEVISRSAFDLQPVFETVAESAVRLCGSDRAFVFRFDGEVLRCVVAYNAPPELETFVRQNPIRPGRGSSAGRAALERRTVHIRDVTIDPEYTYKSKDIAPLRTILTVPILKGEELLGVILTYRLEVNPFTDKQIALVEAFADQAAIAIENVRLFDEVQARTRELSESLEQQTATSRVLGVISSSPTDIQPVFDTIANNAVNLCGATYCIAYNFDGEMIRMLAHHNLDRAAFDALNQLWPMRPDSRSVVGLTILGRDVLHVEDVAADPNYIFANARPALGIRTYLGVPMMREGQPIGAIALYRRDVKPFSDRQIELVKSFADQAVIAIENVRLFERVEARTRELAKSLEELRTTQDRLVQTQKLALLGQLTAGIAHEIKNPLNFVNNFSGISAELIDELQDTLTGITMDDKARIEINELTNTLKSNFDKVVHHGRRADAIVKNMLQHSRESSGEHRVIDINALVEESLNLAWHGARAETQGFEIKVKRSFDGSAGEVDVFPQDIRRALLNVISNGFYAATRRRAETNGGDYEPTLTASTKNLGDRVEITIRDNGTGITPGVKEKMFNPFFTTKPSGEGTGLGLSISHDIIVKQHAGSIEIDTQPGEFTEIRVILPRVPALLPE